MQKKKSVSFDAMVKFFMKHYNIPTRRDIDRLITKLERLEAMVKDTAVRAKTAGSAGRDVKGRLQSGRPGMTASDTVLEIIKETGDEGAIFSEIQDKTGFGEKKIRNIVFRLNKLEKIKRKNRGIYIVG